MRNVLLGIVIGIAATLLSVLAVTHAGSVPGVLGEARGATPPPATLPAAAATATQPAQQTPDPFIEIHRRGDTQVEVLQYSGESMVRISRGERWMHLASMFSKDNNHGWKVVAVAISPDGNRVAYQCESSGGHQPYREPVTLVDVTTGKAQDVENLLIARGVKKQCPCYFDSNLRLEWKDNRTLLVPVHGYQAEDMPAERISLQMGKQSRSH